MSLSRRIDCFLFIPSFFCGPRRRNCSPGRAKQPIFSRNLPGPASAHPVFSRNLSGRLRSPHFHRHDTRAIPKLPKCADRNRFGDQSTGKSQKLRFSCRFENKSALFLSARQPYSQRSQIAGLKRKPRSPVCRCKLFPSAANAGQTRPASRRFISHARGRANQVPGSRQRKIGGFLPELEQRGQSGAAM